MSLKLRKQANSGHDLNHHVTQAGNRLTTEMSSAIKRQEQISSMDYWKTGFSGLGLINSPNVTHKRPSFQTLTRVNIDQVFPGLYLPNAISLNHQKLRNRARLAPTLVFNRSRTTLESSGDKFQDREYPSPRKASMPDLTCVQLADSLLSPNQSSLSGLLRLSPTNTRYVDMFSDDEHSSDEEKAGSNTVQQERKTLKHKNITGRRSNSLPAIKYKTLEPYESKLKNEQNRQVSSPTTIVVTKVLNDKTAKPILKSSESKSNSVLSGASTGYDSMTLRRSNTLPETMEQRQQSRSTQTTDPSLPMYRTTISSNVARVQRPREYIIPIVHSFDDSGTDPRTESRMKRSVTFNSDHKVHEYVPHEPICS